jgi:serine/threonine protein kinase
MTAETLGCGTDIPCAAASPRLGGRFQLLEQVSVAGGASAWRANDEVLCRTVTVHLLASGPVTADLRDAVRAAARLADPRLARIFDVDYDAERPYVVSEWAPGRSLEQLASARSADPALAATIIAEAGEALAIGHEAGIPHLCLDPHSLRWGESGVKITGLGLEAALRRPRVDDPASADTRALARMLYALLTGCWPGTEPTALPAAPWHRRGWYSPRQVTAGVPRALNRITCSALRPENARAPLCTPAHLARALRQAGQVPPFPRGRV